MGGSLIKVSKSFLMSSILLHHPLVAKYIYIYIYLPPSAGPSRPDYFKFLYVVSERVHICGRKSVVNSKCCLSLSTSFFDTRSLTEPGVQYFD